MIRMRHYPHGPQIPTAGGIQETLPNTTGKLTILQMLRLLEFLPASQTITGATAPAKNPHSNGLYIPSFPKNFAGPTNPHKILPLKCTRAIGQVNPLTASKVQIPRTFANIQLRTPIWVREETIVATIWMEKRSRGGIFI